MVTPSKLRKASFLTYSSFPSRWQSWRHVSLACASVSRQPASTCRHHHMKHCPVTWPQWRHSLRARADKTLTSSCPNSSKAFSPSRPKSKSPNSNTAAMYSLMVSSPRVPHSSTTVGCTAGLTAMPGKACVTSRSQRDGRCLIDEDCFCVPPCFTICSCT